MIRLVVAGVAALLVTFWLHRRLVRAPGVRGRWAVAADVVLIVLGVATTMAFAVGDVFDPEWARPIGFVGFTWAAVVYYLLLGTVAIAIVSGVVRVVRRVVRRPGGGLPRRVLAGSTAVVVVAALAVTGYGLTEAASPRIVEHQADLNNLPAAFDGVRIALVTDVHVGSARGEGFVRRVVDDVMAQHPDLILLGGDLTDGTVAKVGPDLEPLRDLHAPLGVFGISGNHEYYVDDGGAWLDFWETLGITTLRNERVELQRGGDVVDLAGVYDETAPDPYAPDYAAALGDRDRSRPVILLAHQPIQAEDAAEYGVDLQLSGHTHDGQLWPNTYLVRFQQPVTAGWGDVDGVPVYVTRGTGAWGPPVRVLAPPEITVLTLRPSPAR
ncbi:metallophosphoesterase [Gordonia sp. HY002]|uniref:metallophosphoesterase n=1 Tax=Gordonia zhenghanii TaxID=2911516 RepID=UPI001EF08BDE|nr:metallophosphoesterase [Gordonia zhenghanii]MCF8570660.1 metallophosphoesterase [Gordonia zhenghanii]MCF8608061.1 metallophosphoesterase [Gordonia zhenghanii]